MSNNQDTHAGGGSPEPCVSPEVGNLLPDFIAELLSAEEAEEVRAHFGVCGRCAEDYHHTMSLRVTAQKLFAAAAAASGPPARKGGGPVVRHISDYKK